MLEKSRRNVDITLLKHRKLNQKPITILSDAKSVLAELFAFKTALCMKFHINDMKLVLFTQKT